MFSPTALDLAAILAAWLLIVFALLTIPGRLRRSRPRIAPPPPAAVLSLDEITADTEPMPQLAPRMVMDANSWLWSVTTEDCEGTITAGLMLGTDGRLALMVQKDGLGATGVQLPREDAQAVHHVLVRWLADTARTVTSR